MVCCFQGLVSETLCQGGSRILAGRLGPPLLPRESLSRNRGPESLPAFKRIATSVWKSRHGFYARTPTNARKLKPSPPSVPTGTFTYFHHRFSFGSSFLSVIPLFYLASHDQGLLQKGGFGPYQFTWFLPAAFLASSEQQPPRKGLPPDQLCRMFYGRLQAKALKLEVGLGPVIPGYLLDVHGVFYDRLSTSLSTLTNFSSVRKQEPY